MRSKNNAFLNTNKEERRRSVSNSVSIFESDFDEMINSYRSIIKKLNLSFKNFIAKLKSNLKENSKNSENPNHSKFTKDIDMFEKKEEQLFSIIKKHLKNEKKDKETAILKKSIQRRQTMAPSSITKRVFNHSFKSYLDPRSTSLSRLEKSNFTNPNNKNNFMNSQFTIDFEKNNMLPIKKSETAFGFKSNMRSEFGNNLEINNDSSLSNNKSNKSNKSEFGDISRKFVNDELKSLKSDVTRRDQEIKMLNKEINLLKKQLIQQTKNSLFLTEKLKKFNLQDEKVKNKIIHNLKVNLKETEKKVNDLHLREEKSRKSLLLNSNISQLSRKKSQNFDVMKIGLKNAMKEKKEFQVELEKNKEELKTVKLQLKDLKKELDKKDIKIKEVENINEELTNKYIITAHRETNLNKTIEKLMSKLRAYEKYVNEVKSSK